MTNQQKTPGFDLEPDPRLDRVVVVLDHTQDLVNIAAVVRAMKNMGLSRLHLVNPEEFDSWRITGIAHRTNDIVNGAQFFDSLEGALSEMSFVVGTTARMRTAGVNYERPRELASTILERTGEGEVALLFGPEDRGLSNEALDLCHAVAVIPTDPRYTSLNLAQACLVLLYELRMAADGAPPPLPKGRRATEPATHGELEQMYDAMEQGLAAIDFFKARKPESVMRTLRKIFGQTRMDGREARLMAAIGYEMRHVVTRLRSSDSGHPSCTDEVDSASEGAAAKPPES